MRLALALLMAKGAARLSRVLGRGSGQALPGLVGERLDPQLIRKLCGQLGHGVILVTGTNGKTTTTKLIAAGLEAAGQKVLSNSTGSNLRRGIASALVGGANWRGQLKATVGLFEVDEASLRRVAAELEPKAIVVLNLFRDQLDRYGELDTTAKLIGEGIAATKAAVYLNADDPLVASLSSYAVSPALVGYFGVDEVPKSAAVLSVTATDSDRCPVCHSRLVFERVFYGHIGHYHCPNGDFKRPKVGALVTGIESLDRSGSVFTVLVEGEEGKVRFPLPGIYNLYNALAAVSVLHGVGVKLATIIGVISRAEPAFGRVERVEVGGRVVYLLLIKNPAGFSQVMETFLLSEREASVLLVINDLTADGRDVSWLWDVPLESLRETKDRLLVSGIRAADMALRLHYAGLDSVVVEPLGGAIRRLLEQTKVGDVAYVLPTYTAMLEVRKVLSKLVHLPEIN